MTTSQVAYTNRNLFPHSCLRSRYRQAAPSLEALVEIPSSSLPASAGSRIFPHRLSFLHLLHQPCYNDLSQGPLLGHSTSLLSPWFWCFCYVSLQLCHFLSLCPCAMYAGAMVFFFLIILSLMSSAVSGIQQVLKQFLINVSTVFQ